METEIKHASFEQINGKTSSPNKDLKEILDELDDTQNEEIEKIAAKKLKKK